MSEPNPEQKIEAEDLDLVNPALEDEGKTADELWQEFDADEADAATDGDATADAQSAAADTEGDGEDAGASTDAQPARKPEGEDKAPPAQGAAQGDNAEGEVDWAKLPAAARKAYERLQQSERSQRGRVSTLQRQLNERAAREGQQQTGSGPQTGADKGKPQAKTDSLLDDPEIKAVVEEYPDVAKPILKAVSRVAERQAQRDQADETKARVAHWTEQQSLLKKEHPDYQDVIAANPGAWGDWLSEQPRHVQEAANRNLIEIEDAAEAADVIGRFKAFRSAKQDPPANNGKGSNTGSLSGRRQRQLDSSSAARGRGPGAARGIPEDGDPEQIWKMFDEEERLAKTG